MSRPNRQLMAKQLLVAVLLFAGLGLLLSTNNSTRNQQHQSSEDLTINAADWFAKDVTARIFDANGNLERKLQAKQLLHYDNDQTTQIKQPHFTLTKPAQPPWTSSAETGVAYHQDGSERIERLQLRGKVKLLRQKTTTSPAMEMHTDELTLYPDQAKADSASRIKLEQPGHRIKAHGMQASLKDETVTLLDGVHGHHDLHTTAEPHAEIYANNLHYNHKQGHAIYRGKVSGSQGERSLRAEKLELITDSEKQLERVLAFGSPATFSTPTELGFVTGQAKQINMHKPTGALTLIDDASLHRGEESYSAPKIEYNVDQEVINSPDVGSGRTKITISNNTVSNRKALVKTKG